MPPFLSRRSLAADQSLTRVKKSLLDHSLSLCHGPAQAGKSGSGSSADPGSQKAFACGPQLLADSRAMKPRSRNPSGQDETLGERIARLRRAKGWNQRELAERAGTKGTQISKFERGTYSPRLETLAKLAEALESTTDFLLTGRQPKEARDTRLRARLPLLESLPRELRDVIVEFLDALLNTQETIERARKKP